MTSEYDEKSSKALNYMIKGLENDRWYFEGDIEYEYTPFEEEIKDYCDSYFEVYIANGEGVEFFNSLKSVVEAIVECNADMYDEDFFRPAELITYYLGKTVSSDDDLKVKIREWLVDFCDVYEGDMLVEDYFKPFLNGERIYHADNYYTGFVQVMMRVV